MYESHFGLRLRPFRAAPDSALYYPSTTHESALADLQRALADEEGLALLTGEAGTGKTLLCHCLLQRTAEPPRSAFLTHSHVADRLGLLQAIAFELGVPHEGRSEQELRLALTGDLLKHCAEAGSPTLLFVDEAHQLGLDALEELRLLANLEGTGTRAVQVVLAGHADIHRTLEHPALASLRQRFAARAHLDPLGLEEAADYLLHHLRRATDKPEKLMDGEALELLARGTRGVPRLLNQAAHRALTLACLAEAPMVDAEAAMEAMLALGLEVEEPGQDDGLMVERQAARPKEQAIMGKMFDAFHQARAKRNPAASTQPPHLATVWPEEDSEAPSLADEMDDMPFIEVGGPHEPGEKVLPAPLHAPPPKPVIAKPVEEVKETAGLMRVRFRALAIPAPTQPASRFAAELVAYHQPDHAIALQYRELVAGLLAQTPRETPRVLCFSGAVSGAGTTTVLLNAAIVLAKQNLRRVAVVDANLRRCAIAQRLGLAESPGLRDVLANRLPLEQALSATALPGLSALPAGTTEASGPSRLAGEAMRGLLRLLAERFDLVLVDAPCWDGRPEAVALGCACDAVYLCMPERMHDESAELLSVVAEQGASLRGCILTQR